MRSRSRRNNSGFTLTEVTVALGGLGVLTLVAATLLVQTVNTYGRVSTELHTTAQARHSLEVIASEMRESLGCSIVDPAAGAPEASVQDALLVTSARGAEGTFSLDANGFPSSQSIVLFYVNTTSEGIVQVVRHRLYYTEDLYAFVPPFGLAAAPYAGGDVVVLDSGGTEIRVGRATGAVNGMASREPPRSLINRASSFDIIYEDPRMIEILITCRVADRSGRVETSRLSKRVVPRNL